MCLDKVIPLESMPKGIVEGYKVFRAEGGNLFGEYRSESKVRPVETWIQEATFRGSIWPFNARPKKIRASDDEFYPSGFHVYVDIPKWTMGRNHIVFRVSIKDIVAYGEDGGEMVVVCKQIYIHGIPIKQVSTY